MTLADALAAAAAAITAVAHDALTNGDVIFNTAVPSSSHVRTAAKWVVVTDANAVAAMPTLEAAICKMSAAHMDPAARNAVADKLAIEMAVIVALGRAAAWQMLGLTGANLKPAEVIPLTPPEIASTVHADHQLEVETAVNAWSPFATRLVGIAWYNALSFESVNHHHLPAKSKKLASTTIGLLGMKEFFTTNAAHEAEGIVMHDMFHPLGYDVKAKLARNIEWARALPNLNFGNLGKRVPVKAADCGLAFNFGELHRIATTYSTNRGDLPQELAAPPELAISIAAYTAANDATQARTATEELRAMSPHFAVATAYLAGFILGKERKASGEPDAELADFRARITILGSPAIARTTGEHAGAFNLGITRGKARVYGWGSDDRVAATLALVKSSSAAAVSARAAVLASRPAVAP